MHELILIAFTGLLQTAAASGPLTYTAPAGWTSRTPSSSMRVAEFVLPRAQGDAEDGDLVVYFFGGSGGSVEANIERWLGQVQRPAGAPEPKRESRQVNGLTVTLLDVSGTYTAEVRPGATERHNKPGYRLRAAVIETPGGPYFVKLVGPAKTIERWDGAFGTFIDSVKFRPVGAK
jgi:hypothetical protein